MAIVLQEESDLQPTVLVAPFPFGQNGEEANGAQLSQDSAHRSRGDVDDGQWLELKNGERVKVLNAACLENVEENEMPIEVVLVGGKVTGSGQPTYWGGWIHDDHQPSCLKSSDCHH